MKKSKQTKSKKVGSSRKASKSPVAAKAPKAARTKERDPRLPAAGTTLTRRYKGKELKVAVLEDGFRFEGEEFRSLSSLAAKLSGAASVNGFLWFGLTERKAATRKPDTAKDTAPPAAAAKTRAPKRASKVRRAGRDAQPVAPKDAAPEVAPAAETPAA